MIRSLRCSFLVILLLFTAGTSLGQVDTGTPPFGSFSGGPDIINNANLNAHITIPVLHKAGRGTSFSYDLTYDSSVWYPVTSGSTTSWQPVNDWGWNVQTAVATGFISLKVTSKNCSTNPHLFVGFITTLSNWVYHDMFGVAHPFAGSVKVVDEGCPGTSTSLNRVAFDGSGYRLQADGINPSTITLTSGTIIIPPVGVAAGAGTFTDRNGNQITDSGNGVFTDTLGITALTVSAGAPSPTVPVTLTYTAPSGTPASYTVKYTNYSVQTHFACSVVSEYGPTTIALVSEIDLPDIAANPSDKYTFTYEQTPGVPSKVTGRLASVTLPTGGTITYNYTGGSNGIVCADGSTSGLQRYTPDTGSNYWNYARSGTSPATTTTVTDPLGNNTVVQYQGIYEAQRDTYQGAVSSSNLLQTIKACYNGNTTNCTTTAVTLPITQRNIFTILPSNQQSEHDDFWNGYGGPTETDDYDYGAAPHGPLLKKIIASYAILGNITAFRQTVTTQNGSGATVAKINYNYDEGTRTATSGTPHHVSVPAPWGNLTSTNIYSSSGTFLTKSTTYYDTGKERTTTGANGAVTTFNYASGATSCYNSFPTSVTEAISTLSTSSTWNCTGGVQLTSVDENAQTTTTAYTDPYFWRPASITDPTGATTSFCYGSLSSTGVCTLNANQTESTLNFNSGNSTIDALTTLDGLARSHVQQTRQAPSYMTFDSVETDYDALGRVSRVTLPYSGTAGQTNTSVAGTTTSYDALSRPLTVLDGGNGSTIFYYGQPGSQDNDVLVTRSPAAAGENTKRRQFEYDGLGQLTSACEITGAAGSGNCAQTASQTGYWTKYTYHPMGNLLTVTQNAQAAPSLQQSRTYSYDWMSRMISETVPEIGATGNGTATYTYDSDTTCGTYAGDLVKRVDAAGNVICSSYDALHRELTRTYPSGAYASATPQKHFVYDTATIDTTPATTVVNAKARLAEAYTCFSPCTTKLTDIGLSYTVRGETSDVYEATPNSGTYYHVAQSYWANYMPNQLTGNIGLPATITYSPDSQGRVNSLSASSGQSPVISSTVYNTAGLPTAINLGSGSGDADSYGYDPQTNRMTQYTFTVNGTSLTAALGWNANGTLQTQNIADGFNSADTQNCSYAYDDLTRLISADCGSAASQAFAYDPFGNINKSGSPYSFLPNYSSSTNRMTLLGTFTPTYDSNGNLTNDSLHNFAWDADGHPVIIDAGLPDAVSGTYDALGRMVEQNRGGTYTQIAYSPLGEKLALMSGQTLQKGVVPLSGTALAVYSSSGLQYYAHADYLGSIRLATTPARGMYFDTAYAPFGETYATSGTLDPAYTGQMNDTAHRQDTAGGLYDFPIREYSTQGRWPNPDPLGTSATCPKDPQTQNRYAYVRDNPMSYTDPTGGMTCPFCPPDGGGGGGGGCSPDDSFCNPCFWDPFFCFFPFPPFPPIDGDGGGGGGGGGGRNPEKPRTFPWPQLPAGFFGSFPNISFRIATTTYKLVAGTTGLCKYVLACGGYYHTCGQGDELHYAITAERCPPYLVFEELVVRIGVHSKCIVGLGGEAFFPPTPPCT